MFKKLHADKLVKVSYLYDENKNLLSDLLEERGRLNRKIIHTKKTLASLEKKKNKLSKKKRPSIFSSKRSILGPAFDEDDDGVTAFDKKMDSI